MYNAFGALDSFGRRRQAWLSYLNRERRPLWRPDRPAGRSRPTLSYTPKALGPIALGMSNNGPLEVCVHRSKDPRETVVEKRTPSVPPFGGSDLRGVVVPHPTGATTWSRPMRPTKTRASPQEPLCLAAVYFFRGLCRDPLHCDALLCC